MTWLALDRQYCWHPFTQAQTAEQPLNIVRAQGAYLYDEHNKAYLDAISSWWVNLHGHAHPTIAQAIAEQAKTLEHVMFGGVTHPPAIQLAQQLIGHLPAPLQYVFYSDNGATAVEIALKMAGQYWRNQGSPRKRFLAFQGAYHGDTFGAMATGKSCGFYTPFNDWLFEVDFLPYPETWNEHDPEEREAEVWRLLEAYLARYSQELVAFILEPLVQGAAGMRMARPAFVGKLVERIQAEQIPVIFDEVMTGFGRTGTFFATEQLAVTPDIICLSKGLTGGFLPMAATVAKPHIYQAFLDDDVGKALLHGHSYTANPLGCAAALASLQVFREENTLARIQQITQLQQRLLRQLSAHPMVSRARQRGVITAFEMQHNDPTRLPAPWLRAYMREQGVLLRPLGATVYVLPPYCISDDMLESLYEKITQALDQWSRVNQIGVAHQPLTTDYF
jgi:adenosylmethionine-8-amino-7-oxononanoate aminotransferase